MNLTNLNIAEISELSTDALSKIDGGSEFTEAITYCYYYGKGFINALDKKLASGVKKAISSGYSKPQVQQNVAWF